MCQPRWETPRSGDTAGAGEVLRLLDLGDALQAHAPQADVVQPWPALGSRSSAAPAQARAFPNDGIDAVRAWGRNGVDISYNASLDNFNTTRHGAERWRSRRPIRRPPAFRGSDVGLLGLLDGCAKTKNAIAPTVKSCSWPCLPRSLPSSTSSSRTSLLDLQTTSSRRSAMYLIPPHAS